MNAAKQGDLHVGVVLGDPNLPYPYSVDGRFGEEEIEGARHLREALARLDGYRFTWFEDHQRLIDDFTADPLTAVAAAPAPGLRRRRDHGAGGRARRRSPSAAALLPQG